MGDFNQNLARLRDDLVVQAKRVQDLFLRAVESLFERDAAKAREVVEGDRVIDRVDVDIERASIPLLAMGERDEHNIRSVLTIVKVNNELERIADCGVNIAEAVVGADGDDGAIPATFRLMANSVVGMIRETNRALEKGDVKRAEQVLDSDDTVDRFKREILLDAQKKVAAGKFSVEFAFRLHAIVKSIERAADHCTNICEQVIYLETGQIVRHLAAGWSDPAAPETL